MKTVVTGVTATITNQSDLAVLAEIVSRLDYNTLDAQSDDPMTVTKQQYEEFLGRVGKGLQDVGLLDDELVPTGALSA